MLKIDDQSRDAFRGLVRERSGFMCLDCLGMCVLWWEAKDALGMIDLSGERVVCFLVGCQLTDNNTETY